MSHIEQKFSRFLSRYPEIEKTYFLGLINRRALARFLIKKDMAKPSQMQAVIAMLRRYDFPPPEKEKDVFKDIRISIKDRMKIMTFPKNSATVLSLKELVENTNFISGQTVKIILGSTNLTIITEEERETDIDPSSTQKDVSEISIQFPKEAVNTKGVLSYLTKELSVNNISISELMTSGNEVLLYLRDEYVVDAYEIIKRLD